MYVHKSMQQCFCILNVTFSSACASPTDSKRPRVLGLPVGTLPMTINGGTSMVRARPCLACPCRLSACSSSAAAQTTGEAWAHKSAKEAFSKECLETVATSADKNSPFVLSAVVCTVCICFSVIRRSKAFNFAWARFLFALFAALFSSPRD